MQHLVGDAHVENCRPGQHAQDRLSALTGLRSEPRLQRPEQPCSRQRERQEVPARALQDEVDAGADQRADVGQDRGAEQAEAEDPQADKNGSEKPDVDSEQKGKRDDDLGPAQPCPAGGQQHQQQVGREQGRRAERRHADPGLRTERRRQQRPGQAEAEDRGDDVAMRSQPRLKVGEQLARAGEAEADPAGEEGHEGQGRDHVAERPGGEQVRQGLGVPFLHLLGRQDPLLMRHGRPVKRQQHDQDEGQHGREAAGRVQPVTPEPGIGYRIDVPELLPYLGKRHTSALHDPRQPCFHQPSSASASAALGRTAPREAAAAPFTPAICRLGRLWSPRPSMHLRGRVGNQMHMTPRAPASGFCQHSRQQVPSRSGGSADAACPP